MARYCKFEIKDGIGYKTYTSKEICDYAYNAQREAFMVDAGPKPLDRIDDFTYTTELADTKPFIKLLAPGVYYNFMFPDLHYKLEYIFRDNPNPERWGPEGVDLANHNLGLYNGRVVCVDFY